jgi:hypothetical protein
MMNGPVHYLGKICVFYNKHHIRLFCSFAFALAGSFAINRNVLIFYVENIVFYIDKCVYIEEQP